MSEQRFSLRRRSERRRRVVTWLVRFVVVAVVAGLIWLVWFSQVLGVHHVKVEGLTTLKAEQVREVADLSRGQPLARLDTTAVASRVARIPRVERVSVERHWPRTVTVVVTQRKAVAWTEVDGKQRALDRYGIDFHTLKKVPKGFVEVRTTATDPRQRQLALTAAATVVSTLTTDAPDLAKQVQVVDAPTRDAVTLDLTKGRTVTWGSGAKAEEKIVVLRSLLSIKAKGYDVSAPEQPTTRN